MTTVRVLHSRPKRGKTHFIISILLFLYFAALLAVNYFRVDATMIGVLREILTIPAVVSVFVLVVQSAIDFYKEHYRVGSLPFYSLLVLGATIAMMLLFA